MAKTTEAEIVVKAKDQASGILGKIKSGLGGVAQTASGFVIGGVVLGTLGKLKDAALGAAAGMLDYAASMEQSKISFTTMLGSAEKADKLMADIKETAASTPFEVAGLTAASKQLLAFGIETDNIIPSLRMLGDVASGIGADVGDLSYLFGTIKTQGKAMTVDINQFANRGIPIWDELAKITGKSGSELRKFVEEGKVGFPQVEQVFKNLTGEGGKFFGLMENQSQSFSGIMSNISDSINEGLDQLMTDTGIFDALKTGMDGFREFLDGFFSGIEENMPTIKEALKSLGDAFLNLNEAFNLFGNDKDSVMTSPFDTGAGAANIFTTVIQGVVGAVTQLVNWVANNKDAIVKFFEDGKKAVTDVIAFVGQLITTVQSIVGTVSSVVAFFVNGFNFLMSVITSVRNLAEAFIAALVAKVTGFVKRVTDIANTLASAFTQKFEEIKNKASQIVEDIIGFFRDLPSRISSFISNIKLPSIQLPSIFGGGGGEQKHYGGFVRGYATGGIVGGMRAGTGRDNIMIRAEKGEAVLTKRQQESIMNQLDNSGGQPITINNNFTSTMDVSTLATRLAFQLKAV
jgi:tape measure domain-containing protein